MLCSVNSALKASHRDTQKQRVYALDDFLWSKMLDKGLDFPKLFRGKNIDCISINEVYSNIQNDFGLNMGELIQSTNNNHYYNGQISLSANVIFDKNIEVLLHEIAHAFQDLLFSSSNQQDHGAEFVSILRWLMNFYEIFSFNEFDKLVQNFDSNIDYFYDFIDLFLPCSEDEVNEARENSKKIKNFYHQDSYFVSWNSYTRVTLGNEKQLEHFVRSYVNEKCFHVRINRCAHEYENPFNSLTKEEFNNTILISPVFIMDEYGNKITAEFWSGYYGFILASCNSEMTFFDCEPFLFNPDSDGKKDANSNKTKSLKELKNSGKKIIKASSYKEYIHLLSIMKNRYFELR